MITAVQLAFVASVLAAPPQWLGSRPTRVERIVSLAPSATELLFAIGAGDRVVGVTRFDDRPPAVRQLPKVGGFIDPDPEAVLALEPDLVVAIPTSAGRARIDTLARLGMSVLVLPGASIDDLWITLETLGEVTGTVARATALSAELQQRLDGIGTRHRNLQPIRVLVVVGRRPLIAAGNGTFFDGLLGLVGAVNVVQRGGTYPQLDLEAVVALDPEVIVDVTIGTPESGEVFWARARQVRAVERGRVVQLTDDSLLRPGPRLADGLAMLARALRPDRP
ncbi:MAG: cobalamin-binding protein [Myxococcota bacterium]